MNSLLEKHQLEIEEKFKIFQDKSFFFDEKSHTYTYDGTKFDSVTTFIKRFKLPFDRSYWSQKKADELGVDVESILEEWQQKANISTRLGTRVHKYIEDFWSNKNPEKPEEGTEERIRVEKFLEIYEKRLKVLVPLKSELKIFSKKWRLAGTIDQSFLLWEESKQKPIFIIGDWKTNGDFRHDDHPKGKYKKLLRPFAHLWENHHNEYSIQISLYRLMLEEEIGIETDSGFLCHIGPDDAPKIYPAKDLRIPLKAYLDENRSEFDIFEID